MISQFVNNPLKIFIVIVFIILLCLLIVLTNIIVKFLFPTTLGTIKFTKHYLTHNVQVENNTIKEKIKANKDDYIVLNGQENKDENGVYKINEIDCDEQPVITKIQNPPLIQILNNTEEACKLYPTFEYPTNQMVYYDNKNISLLNYDSLISTLVIFWILFIFTTLFVFWKPYPC